MNREAGYFKNKQFFYDIFHGYNHTCSKIYSSKNLIHLNSLNSSICEQFNSYLQCIKSSAKQMSQEHFMFFLQYIIRLWNEKKKKSWKNWALHYLGRYRYFALTIRWFSLSVIEICSRCNSFVLCLSARCFWKYPQDLLFTFITFCHDLQQILIKTG